jgi:hypothetical protein
MEHQVRVLVRVGAPGDPGVWLGVLVCLACEPDEEVRRTFAHNEPCPGWGGEGALEWRWWPEAADFIAPRVADATGQSG